MTTSQGLTQIRSTRDAARDAFLALLLRDIAVLRKEAWFFTTRVIAQPLFLVFVFTYVFPKIGRGIGQGDEATASFNDILLGGVVGSAIIFQGIQAVALPLVQDFGFTREIEDRVLAPLPTSLVAIEKVAAGAIQGLLAALIVFPLALFIPANPIELNIEWPALLTLLPLGCIFSASMGLSVGTRVEPNRVALIFSLLLIPMIFLGCAYYTWHDLQAIPWLKWFVLINPLVYLSEGMRLSLANHVPHMSPLVIYSVLIAFSAALMWLGVEGFKKRVLS